MKAILISDELHARLKAYTHSQNMFLGKYVEGTLYEMLTSDEISICPIHKKLWNSHMNLFKKIKTEGENIIDTEEFQQSLQALENYHNNKNK
jgi:hypothetical protein